MEYRKIYKISKKNILICEEKQIFRLYKRTSQTSPSRIYILACDNMQAAGLNLGKAITQADLSARLEDARNKFQADVTNSQIESQNQSNRMQVANMNDADRQAHRDALLNSVGAIGTNLSGVGTQITRANIASNLGNYDVSGNYKINQLRNQYIEANPGAKEEEFQAWLAENNFI